MRPDPGDGRRGLKLRVRLMALIAAVVAAVAGVTAWTCLVLAERSFELRFDDRLVALVEDVRSNLENRDREIVHALDRTGTHLVKWETGLLERLLDPDPERRFDLIETGAGLANQFGLPVLEVLDERGAIVTSGHWPQNAGKTDDEARRLPQDVPIWIDVELAAGPRIARVARHSLVVGDRRIEIVGGRLLDAEMLRSLVGPRTVAVFVPESGPGVSTAPGGGEAGDGAEAENGSTTRSIDLESPEGNRLGRIDLIIDRAPLDRLLARLRWAVAVLVIVGGGVGMVAGAWIGRRATRPVDETLRALDAVAAGEADYDFPRATRDDLEALPEAFSRLHRALDDQQRQRLAAERVAAWREVARRVAHEVKNPLAPIRLTVENLMKARRKSPAIFDEIFDDGARAILEEVSQLQRLVTEFSEFARLPEPNRVSVDLDEMVDSVLTLYSSEPGLVVERRRLAAVPPVSADRDLLARALKNLVANAVEAMGDAGGTLGVETTVEAGRPVVRILDTGSGFSEEAELHLFEPYFTTRPTGTGLGMALAFRIVTEHGGMLAVSNRPGGGAEVVVRLEASR